VGVSDKYIKETKYENILCLGNSIGLKLRPLGYIIQIAIDNDIPITNEIANFKNSESEPLYNTNKQAKNIYKNHDM